MTRECRAEAQKVMKIQAQPDFPPISSVAAVKGNNKRQRPEQMFGDPEKYFPLGQVEAHKPEIESFEMPQSTVFQACGSCSHAAAVIRFFE